MIGARRLNVGVTAALGAALLFGAGTPLAKLLLGNIGPWMLAALFYLGSGIGLTIYRVVSRSAPVKLPPGEAGWLAGATIAGGVIGPVLLMLGLTGMSASSASLLLNAEGVFTALLAWIAFRESFDRRIALGMAAIAAGAVLLSWPQEVSFSGLWPVLSILGACFAWGIDNNLTRKVSLNDAIWIASVKGLVAGIANLALAMTIGDGDHLPSILVMGSAMLVGFLAYGVSLALFVVGLRHLGTARTGAYFSVAPFVGAALALVSGEAITPRLLMAGLLMGLGVWLHLTEKHEHPHIHDPLDHEHEHAHDDHHLHEHPDQRGIDLSPGQKHTHRHHHSAMEHAHAHFPDAHHRHVH